MDSLIKGEHYSELPTSYIIFICNFAPFNKDIPIYTFFTKCEEIENLTLEDKMIKKMFNAKAYFKESDIEIKSLLEYISSRKPVDDFTDKIHNLISKIKKKEVNKREYENMNIHDQDTFYRGKKEGIQQGAYQTKVETAKKFISMKLPLEQISEGTGLSLEIVEKLAKEEVVKS